MACSAWGCLALAFFTCPTAFRAVTRTVTGRTGTAFDVRSAVDPYDLPACMACGTVGTVRLSLFPPPRRHALTAIAITDRQAVKVLPDAVIVLMANHKGHHPFLGKE